MEEETRFEEVDDTLEDWGGLGEVIKEPRDCSFGKIYGPIRALFATDPNTLQQFEACEDHAARLRFLLGMEVVRSCLADISPLREGPGGGGQQEEVVEVVVEEVVKVVEEAVKPRRDPPRLSHGANKKYPHLSKAVEVKHSPEEGRYMVARQRILPGEVLVVEPAAATSLFRESYGSHCYHCFGRLPEEALPCPACPTVRFCSAKCRALGLRLHRWECALLEYVDGADAGTGNDIGHMATLAFRLVVGQGYHYIASNMDSLDSQEPTYKAQDYLAVYRQEANMAARPSGDHLKRGVTGLILARCLQLSGWFPPDLRSSLAAEEVVGVTALLVRHIQSCACNAYEINELVRSGSSMIDSSSSELGGAVYPTISLSNHACTGNTSRTNFGTTGVLRATRTINTNEKVFDNYGYFYHVTPRETRRQMLKAQYFFDCSCTACREDWPVYRDLARREAVYHCVACCHPVGGGLDKVRKCSKCKKDLGPVLKISRRLAELQKDFRSVMDSITEESAADSVLKYSALLQDVERICRPPCRELVTCQQVLLQCYAMLGNLHRVELKPEEAQLVPFQGSRVDSDEEDESDDEFDMPGLI